tara:strand:+ start:119 stop:547 length:429 start_codon:yes stop_codon:yes gene_type:complete
MAIKDLSKKPYINDRNENIFIGVDLPFRKSNGSEGYFASTSTTIESIKNNVRMLLETNKGERLMQPDIGLNLKKYLFEQLTDDTKSAIENEIVDTFNFWLPFVEVENIQIKMSDNNRMDIKIIFSINRDKNSLQSVQVSIGE